MLVSGGWRAVTGGSSAQRSAAQRSGERPTRAGGATLSPSTLALPRHPSASRTCWGSVARTGTGVSHSTDVKAGSQVPYSSPPSSPSRVLALSMSWRALPSMHDSSPLNDTSMPLTT